MVLQLDNQLRHKTIPIFIFYFTIPFIFWEYLELPLAIFIFFFLDRLSNVIFLFSSSKLARKRKKKKHQTAPKTISHVSIFQINSF